MTKDEARDCDHGRMKGKCEVCDLQAELDATNRQVEILCDALAKSRREIDAMIAVARADEREACAKVCEQEAAGINSEWDCCHETLQDTAAAIRARGENNG